MSATAKAAVFRICAFRLVSVCWNGETGTVLRQRQRIIGQAAPALHAKIHKQPEKQEKNDSFLTLARHIVLHHSRLAAFSPNSQPNEL